MAGKELKSAFTYCSEAPANTAAEFDSLAALKSHLEEKHLPKPQLTQVWDREIYPPPKGVGFIEVNDMKCVGCGLYA
jgi:hypothetical protein